MATFNERDDKQASSSPGKSRQMFAEFRNLTGFTEKGFSGRIKSHNRREVKCKSVIGHSLTEGSGGAGERVLEGCDFFLGRENINTFTGPGKE